MYGAKRHGKDAMERFHAEMHVGVRLALDDFGTGYSSLARLNALPGDVVTIDRSFATPLSEGSIGLTRMNATSCPA